MDGRNKKIGKFENADSLLKAYEALEAEFTKRSQRLKEVCRENERLTAELNDSEKYESYAKNALTREDFLTENILKNDTIKNRVIRQYLTFLNTDEGVRVLGGNIGKSILTPPNRPTSLSEAKKLADKIMSS